MNKAQIDFVIRNAHHPARFIAKTLDVDLSVVHYHLKKAGLQPKPVRQTQRRQWKQCEIDELNQSLQSYSRVPGKIKAQLCAKFGCTAPQLQTAINNYVKK